MSIEDYFKRAWLSPNKVRTTTGAHPFKVGGLAWEG
jgi:hypothetical protein